MNLKHQAHLVPKAPYAKKTKPGKGVFGSRMKAERIAQGWQIIPFCKHTGLTESQVTAWENRGVVPKMFSAIVVATTLKVSLDWLFGLRDEK